MTTRPPKTIVKPTALGPVANTDTKLLIYGLFQKRPSFGTGRGQQFAPSQRPEVVMVSSFVFLDTMPACRGRFG